jgi:hypothetical protein
MTSLYLRNHDLLSPLAPGPATIYSVPAVCTLLALNTFLLKTTVVNNAGAFERCSSAVLKEYSNI